MSHTGGEFEAFEGLAHEIAEISGCRYVDPRTRTDRIENETNHWTTQMGCLVEAYLDYCHHDLGDGMPNCNGIPAVSPSDDTECTLIYHGYIGCAPVYPTVAISLRTLAAYHQTHHVCPSFGFQAQCKALCFLHSVSALPYLTAQLSSAFDVYLEILHCVDQRLHTALKCDTPNWRLLNSCPACFYKLEDEPNLEFGWLISIDGNNSLKRWDSTTYGTNVRLNSRKARCRYHNLARH
ncbi:hypothetical protein BD769DRAFT_1349960 [Suillus cothurnatus]|nr:hypothetical protein BD769DRAFT_1349960 [Suillus cothurnatus]